MVDGPPLLFIFLREVNYYFDNNPQIYVAQVLLVVSRKLWKKIILQLKIHLATSNNFLFDPPV